MRTNIVLNDELVQEGLSLGQFHTKKELINTALEYFIKNIRKKNLMELKGRIKFREDWDYKKMRENHL
ncbi:MAG: type II toxin-antitoxin system VapB family antitoxin [Candidatus Marinimicrobia bacterium]|nr:type II toxin-antitoxin system VapB family antitoxin [Candidatus Neomarinimicrobiota bacterium]